MKVFVNGEYSDVKNVEAGTPQGAVLSPILFNIMTRDIPQREGIDIHIYADDITILCCGDNLSEINNNLQAYLNTNERWTDFWGFTLSPAKTVLQFFTRKKDVIHPLLKLKGTVIEYKEQHKLLGLILDSPLLSWKSHIESLISDCRRRLDIMKVLSSAVWGANALILRTFYISYIRAKIDYGSAVYGTADNKLLDKLEETNNLKTCLPILCNPWIF